MAAKTRDGSCRRASLESLFTEMNGVQGLAATWTASRYFLEPGLAAFEMAGKNPPPESNLGNRSAVPPVFSALLSVASNFP